MKVIDLTPVLNYVYDFIGLVEQAISFDISSNDSMDTVQCSSSNVIAVLKAPGGYSLRGYELNKLR